MQTQIYESVMACESVSAIACIPKQACRWDFCGGTHTNVAHWPADGVALMYFDDMKVDHIYMQIEVSD